MTRGISAFACIAAGCSVVDLTEVEIRGGTADQRRAAREELAAFDQWIGPGRLQIAGLRFEPLPDSFGKYMRPERVVVVDSASPIDRVREFVRHELCHALDYAEDLADQQPALLDEMGVRVERALDLGLNDHRLRREAFAQVCEVAPFTAHLVAHACPGDDPNAEAVAAWLFDQVWTEVDPPPPAPTGPPVGLDVAPSLPPNPPWNEIYVYSTSDPALIVVSVSDGEWFSASIVDRATGARLPQIVEMVLPIVPDAPPGALPLSGTLVPVVGAEAPAVARLEIEVTGLGALADRLLWLDPETHGWIPVEDGCAPSHGGPWTAFVSDDRAWLAELEGERASWRPIDRTE